MRVFEIDFVLVVDVDGDFAGFHDDGFREGFLIGGACWFGVGYDGCFGWGVFFG